MTQHGTKFQRLDGDITAGAVGKLVDLPNEQAL